MCIPGKVRREGEELWHRHIKRALCAQGTLFLESNQVPQNPTKLFRQHRNQSCRPLGLSAFFFFFLWLYRVHWIIWLGLFNRVTFGFSMAQMELTINYLDALIKKKQQLPCGFMRVCWGTRTRGPIVLFSFQWEGGLGRSRRGGYRIIFQEGLKPKLGFIWERRALQWRKWKRTQENRILGSVKCMKGQDD